MAIVTHVQGRARAGAGDARSADPHPGLSVLSTSPKRQGGDPKHPVLPLPTIGYKFDPKEARLTRMAEGIQLGVRLAEWAHTEPGFRPPVAWMLTLTYADPEAWEACHVSRVIDHLRKWARRNGGEASGAWCSEMQDKRFKTRGELAIHYHVIVFLPRGLTPPKPDKQGWWPWGMTKREQVRKSATSYIAKYASKGSEAPLPKGARIFGTFGLGKERVRYTYLRRPVWLRSLLEVGQRVVRRRGGGWVLPDTGEVVQSPWRASFVNGNVVLRRKEEPCTYQ